MDFKKETQIINYNPHSSTRWSKRRYLLLPAWCYRVVAPRVSSRKINILEKAVLGMCRVGAFTAVEIGEKLDIGTDLAALIVKQLLNKTFINHQGLLTDKGIKILETENLETQESVAGFIFQDVWTGELFPRFMERQEYIDVKYNNDGYPDLVFGTTGKPDYKRAYMPLPVNNIIKKQPSPSEILQAVRKHSKALRYKNSEDRDDDEDAWNFEQVPDLKRISFVEEEPIPVWLSTFIYLPENEFTSTSWNICDPFGLGDSPRLRRKLEIQIKKNSTLKGVQKLIQEMIGEYADESGTNFNDLIQIINEEAELTVEDKLTLDIRKWDGLFDDLVAMERSHIQAKNLDNQKYLADKLDDILIKAQKTIERLFLIIREEYPTNDNWKIISQNDRKHNKSILNGIADKLGFDIPLPNSLLYVKQGKIRSASDYGEGSLRCHLLAALLTARNDSNHPLYLVAQKAPDILIRLNTLAELRDKSGHSTSQQLELSNVSQQISTVYDFVASMLEMNY